MKYGNYTKKNHSGEGRRGKLQFEVIVKKMTKKVQKWTIMGFLLDYYSKNPFWRST
jgi:hypothetical protein